MRGSQRNNHLSYSNNDNLKNSQQHEQFQYLKDSYKSQYKYALQGNQVYYCYNHGMNNPSGKKCTHEIAEFYCIQHDMFLCESCFNDHHDHRGAGSIKEHLTKEFNMWNSMLQKVHDLRSKLDGNLAQYKNCIDVMREYYQSENNNPTGIIFTNSTGSFSAT